MGETRHPTEIVQRVGRDALRLLRRRDDLTLKSVASRIGVSPETAKRAFQWLRDQGARLEYYAATRAWRLVDKTFALPLLDPSIEDLQAALTAAGLLRALGQETASERAWALFDEVDVRLHGAREHAMRRDALRVTQTAAIVRDQTWVLSLLRAARRRVVRIRYHSSWKNDASTHVFEPWQVWLHDGVLYARGYSRTRRAPRTLRLANVLSLVVMPGEKPSRSAPTSDLLWGHDDPRFGVDEDRPGIARIRLHGAVARWVAGSVWHPKQEDTWLVEGSRLERRLPYRSCRELARRLAGVADGIESIEPRELLIEVTSLAQRAAGLGA